MKKILMVLLMLSSCLCFAKEKTYHHDEISPFGIGSGAIRCFYKFTDSSYTATVHFEVTRNGRTERGYLKDLARADLNNLSSAFKELSKMVSSDKKYKKFVDTGTSVTKTVKDTKIEMTSDGTKFTLRIVSIVSGDLNCYLDFKREELPALSDTFTVFADKFEEFYKDFTK